MHLWRRHTAADYVGIVDSDAMFITPITPDNLFDDAGGVMKPRIFGYNGCCTTWEQATPAAVGKPSIGEFMVVIGFPIIIKTCHLALAREHIRTTMNATTFEEAFGVISHKYVEHYSQVRSQMFALSTREEQLDSTGRGVIVFEHSTPNQPARKQVWALLM